MEDFLKKEIIIIGAGMAGVSAAFHLNKLGFTNVSVLEAQNRIGGRIHTVHMGSQCIEMGAQWIHGQKDNIIYNIASSNGLINEEVPSYMEKLEDFEFYPEERENILLLEKYLYDKVENSSLTGIASKSVLAYLEDHFQKFLADQPQESVKDVLREAFNCRCLVDCEINGCKDLSLVSLSLWKTYKECEGNPTVELKYGYSKVLDVFLKNIPDGTILTNHKVTKVDWSELSSKSINTFNKNEDTIQQSNVGKIKVFCADNKEFLADHVIVTVPLGYLKKYSLSLFHPPLSEKKQQAIKCIGFDAVDKIYLNFEVPFWSEYAIIPVLWKKEFDEHFPISFDNESSSPFWVKYINRFAYVLGHPNMLCAWITGEGAIKMETLDDTQVVDNCMKLLELLFQKKLPKPMDIFRSTWHSDPHTYGSYSYISVDCEMKNVTQINIAEPEYLPNSQYPSLLFAGEASHPYFFSTVHGACETGFREAERLHHYYKNQDKKVSHEELESVISKIAKVFIPAQNLKNTLKIVIVGAGLAGLSCAVSLAKNKFRNIVILEAQDRIGGRVHSFNHGNGNLDFGAQWLHGTDNELYKCLQSSGILPAILKDTSYEGRGKFCTSSGNIVDQSTVEEIKELVEKVKLQLESGEKDCKDDKSVSSFLIESLESHLKSGEIETNNALKIGLFNWMVKFEIIDNGCDSLDLVAAKSYEEWDDCPPEEYHINIQNGFSTICETLKAQLSNDANIILSKPIKTIKWSEQFKQNDSLFDTRTEDSYPAVLHCEDGEIHHADFVLVTPSIGFLKENLNTFFEPPLPASKCKAIQNVGFGTINKIFLVYEKAFWNEGDLGIQLVWLKQLTKEAEELLREYSWIKGMTGFDVVQKVPNVLVGWIGGEEAKCVEKESNEIVGSVCTKLLKMFLNCPEIPDPVIIFKSEWFSNPYVRGAYSYRTPNFYQCDAAFNDLKEPLYSSYELKETLKIQWPTVIFAGEACDLHSFSSAHGAYRNGLEAADSIIKACSHLEKEYEKLSL